MNPQMERLHHAVESFVGLVEGLDASATGPWGPREVLAHLVFWHESYVGTLTALAKGEKPALPKGTFRELNERAVREHQGVPLADMVRRFRAAQGELERLELANARIPVKAGGTLWAVPALFESVDSHIRSHEAKLRKQTKEL